ncbi:hypothetical protein DEO72_LG11g2326 [Vigna unguiculata]|uniref:Uncharacterized protein n=1 Tax=Vigna unguiculata TaxID=3917 RepID=A0A4D6NU71_VIGUN|nr:hypothetical protein DEO72_LG11g2326 [Vigna unguiculata]
MAAQALGSQASSSTTCAQPTILNTCEKNLSLIRKLVLTPSPGHPQLHLYQHLLPCNESHDHRHTQTKKGEPWTREYDAHTNLPARGPASTNPPARSPALRTSPLVVLLYGPAYP